MTKKGYVETVVGYVAAIKRKFTVTDKTKWTDLKVDPIWREAYYDGIKAALAQQGEKFKGLKKRGMRDTEDMQTVAEFFWAGRA